MKHSAANPGMLAIRHKQMAEQLKKSAESKLIGHVTVDSSAPHQEFVLVRNGRASATCPKCGSRVRMYAISGPCGGACKCGNRAQVGFGGLVSWGVQQSQPQATTKQDEGSKVLTCTKPPSPSKAVRLEAERVAAQARAAYRFTEESRVKGSNPAAAKYGPGKKRQKK